jgi:hypothetical protein
MLTQTADIARCECPTADCCDSYTLLHTYCYTAQCRPRRVCDLVGDFNYLGTIQQHAEHKVAVLHAMM